MTRFVDCQFKVLFYLLSSPPTHPKKQFFNNILYNMYKILSSVFYNFQYVIFNNITIHVYP